MINTNNAISKMLGKTVNKPIVRDKGSKNNKTKEEEHEKEALIGIIQRRTDAYTLSELKQYDIDFLRRISRVALKK